MRAVIHHSFGPPDVLIIEQVPQPKLEPGELLIRTEAAGVSRADVMQRQGKYPPPVGASSILGLDVSGTVERVSASCTRFQPGDRVCALVNGGGYAEFCAVPETQVLPIPGGWSSVEAASLPENLFTVYDNVVTRARLGSGETLLVHGGSSGIGTMAIMVARALDAVPYATAGSAAKCAGCEAIGARAAINYKTTDFVEELRGLTKNHGADVILDLVGAAYLERNIEVLSIDGRIAFVATLGGSSATLPIGKLMAKRGSLVASTLRPRSSIEKGRIADSLLKNVWPILPAKNPIRPVIDAVFPLADARKAHERLEAGEHIGKIILTA